MQKMCIFANKFNGYNFLLKQNAHFCSLNINIKKTLVMENKSIEKTLHEYNRSLWAGQKSKLNFYVHYRYTEEDAKALC